MTFADTSQSSLAIIEEATFGTTPATPTFLNLLITSETLQLTKNKQIDPSVTGSPIPKAKKTLSQAVSGQISGILRYGAEIDLLLEWAMRNDYATNDLLYGTTAKSITIERKHVIGATSHYTRFTGCRCQSFELGINAEGFVTFTAQVQGIAMTIDTAIITGATYTAVTNPDDPMTAPEVASFTADGGSTNPSLQSLTLTINNNTAMQPKVGSAAAAGVRYGYGNVTGSLNAYFEDAALLTAFLANTAADISFVMSDSASNSYTVDMPNCSNDAANTPITGPNADVALPMSFEALYDGTATTHLTITKS